MGTTALSEALFFKSEGLEGVLKLLTVPVRLTIVAKPATHRLRGRECRRSRHVGARGRSLTSLTPKLDGHIRREMLQQCEQPLPVPPMIGAHRNAARRSNSSCRSRA